MFFLKQRIRLFWWLGDLKKKKTESGWLADLNYKNSVNKIMITVVNYRVELGSSSVYLNRTRVCQRELLFPMQTC